MQHYPATADVSRGKGNQRVIGNSLETLKWALHDLRGSGIQSTASAAATLQTFFPPDEVP